jgi:hypothetical protein
MVDRYQDADGLTNPNYGYAWCASLMNWCFKRAGRPLTELKLSASVGNLLAEAKKRGWVHYHTPARGDLICFDWNTLNGPGHGDWPDHIGIVESVNGSTLICIEGNTAIGNDSNGGQVMRRTRSMSMAEGFIRVPGNVPPRFRIGAGGKTRYKSVTGSWIAKHTARLTALARKYKGGVSIKRQKG